MNTTEKEGGDKRTEPQGQKSNIHVIRVLERMGEKDRAENTFEEIMEENSQNLAKDLQLQIEEADQILNGINPKQSIRAHIRVKLLKNENKGKPLRASTEKMTPYLEEKNNDNDNESLLRNRRSTKEVARHFLSLGSKELLT